LVELGIESPWVRDEAGSGRDRGRLVPISLEGTTPPLGFRQFQSIDLEAWKGRGRVPRLREILAAIERQTKGPGMPVPAETAPARRFRNGPSLSTWAFIGLGIGIIFVVVGLLIGRPWEGSGSARLGQQQLSITSARAIDCAVDGLKPGGKALRQKTLKLYLAGCSQLDEASYQDISATETVLEQVVKDAPDFKAGWAKLLLVESSDNPDLQDSTNPNRQTLQRHIQQARQLDPEMPEIAIAQAQLLPRGAYGEALRLLDQAYANSPENADILMYRTDALMRVGRLSEAIANANEAAQLAPTSPFALSNYVLTLAYSGRIQAAREQLQRAEELWAGTGTLRDLEDSFQLRFGDPKALLNTEDFKRSTPAAQLYYRTRAGQCRPLRGDAAPAACPARSACR
jgi:hypothetical protein